MIDIHEFAQKQFELAGEFGKYVMDHPEVGDVLPEESYIFFEINGEEEFNQYSKQLAEKQLREEGRPIVCVKINGLAPAQRSRLIDPVIEPVHAVA